jgi:tRNA (guanosine-2'-O-)-methyltransferase
MSNIDKAQIKQLNEYLEEFITSKRLARIKKVLAQRTRHITIVLEDIFQPQNASAVLRSCECFGIQDVHIIENRYQYELNPDVVLGANKWLNLNQYNETEDNTASCLQKLKEKGYTLVATSPREKGFTPANLPLERPVALLFGTEQEGLTPQALKMADAFLKIPMSGFTESLNISVSAAICLYEISTRLRKSQVKWQLSETEENELLHEWLKKSIKNPDLLIERFRKNKH